MTDTWISVKDNLPNYGQRVLFIEHNRVFIGTRVKTDIEGNHYFDEQYPSSDDAKPNYWQPLPNPPII